MLQILKDFFGSINWSTVITAIPISALVGSFLTYMLNGRREKQKSKKEIIRSAKIINLDLITATFEGIRVQNEIPLPHIGKAPECIPLNSNYSNLINVISEKLTPKELMLLNKTYGILEKIKQDILKYNYTLESMANSGIRMSYKILLVELFDGNIEELKNLKGKDYNSRELMDLMGDRYKSLFEKIDKISDEKI